MKKLILDTDMCKIFQTETAYEVIILTEKTGWVEHNPFPNNLQGLVNALDLSMNVVSGKFWIKGMIDINLFTRENLRLDFRLETKNGSKKN